MSHPSRRATDLQAKLAAIDARLSELEAELDPEREAPAEEPQTTAPRGRSGPLAALLQRAGRAHEVTVSAGPFATSEAVDAFVAAIQELPGVAEAALRGFEGADRAIIEVRLA